MTTKRQTATNQGGRQKIETLKVRELKVDPSYQRPLQPAWVTHLVEEFDPSALAVWEIGRRANGEDYVIDGNHQRTAILNRLATGLPAPEAVLCRVTVGTTVAEEARLFIKRNKHRGVDKNLLFRAECAAEEKVNLEVCKVVESHGFQVEYVRPGRQSLDERSINGIRGAKVLKDCYLQNPACFSKALETLKAAYGPQVPYDLRSGEVVMAMTLFYKRDLTRLDMDISEQLRAIHIPSIQHEIRYKFGNKGRSLALVRTMEKKLGLELLESKQMRTKRCKGKDAPGAES